MISNNSADNTPVGRSWQTMTPIQTGKEEGGLVIYGGFDNALTALGDCWRMDLQHQPSTWVRCPHLELGPRLWHASLELDSSQVMVAGGLTNNILASNSVSKHHAEKVKCWFCFKLSLCLILDHLGFIPESCPNQPVEAVPGVHHSKQGSVQQGGGGLAGVIKEDCSDSLQLRSLESL